jgi:hypothetical protein
LEHLPDMEAFFIHTPFSAVKRLLKNTTQQIEEWD